MANIKYFGELRRMNGLNEEEIQADSISSLINEIGRRYGKPAAKQAKASLITVNGFNIMKYDGWNTKIDRESTVSFYPVCGGG